MTFVKFLRIPLVAASVPYKTIKKKRDNHKLLRVETIKMSFKFQVTEAAVRRCFSKIGAHKSFAVFTGFAVYTYVGVTGHLIHITL